VVSTAILTLAGTAHANVLWTESLDGDLGGNQGSPTVVGSFVSGLNTASGLMSRATNTAPGQGDTFAVTLPAGYLLQSLSFTFSNSTNDELVAATVFRAPVNGQTFSNLGQIFNLSANGTQNVAIPVALQAPLAQDYTLGLSLQFQTSNYPSASLEWEWQATVLAPVPEPAGAVLALAGLGALTVLTRRRSRA
jgi:hypothetical protein